MGRHSENFLPGLQCCIWPHFWVRLRGQQTANTKSSAKRGSLSCLFRGRAPLGLLITLMALEDGGGRPTCNSKSLASSCWNFPVLLCWCSIFARCNFHFFGSFCNLEIYTILIVVMDYRTMLLLLDYSFAILKKNSFNLKL